MQKMRKYVLISMLVLFGFSPALRADEGMWLPFMINKILHQQMKEKGLKLTPEQIYSVNKSSLKDAVVQFGGGCTGEIISNQGLLLTNHHCGYGQIQEHSSVEHNYLEDGFWAMSLEEELPNPGLTVSFLVRVDDVTSRILGVVKPEMSEMERMGAMRKESQLIVKETTEGTHYNAQVSTFYEGNEYYLFVYETYRDVRLVGAPPSSIGKFGHDTDNWMWPRHTGDFSMFRVYTGPDGKPADYAKENIPLKPKHFLPISIKGVKEGDFAMTIGYPGSTDRYLTSYGINLSLEQTYPDRINIRKKKLDIMMAEMEKDEAVRIQYSSKHAGIANYWKNFIGMKRGLEKLNVAADKKVLEDKFQAWVKQSPERVAEYGTVINDLKEAYAGVKPYSKHRYYMIEAFLSGPEVIMLGRTFEGLSKLLKDSAASEDVAKEVEELKEIANDLYKDYYQLIDKNLWEAMFQMVKDGLPAEQLPDIYKSIEEKYNNNMALYAEDVYKTSIFATKESLMGFLESPSAEKLDSDPVIIAMRSIWDNFIAINKEASPYNEKITKARRSYMKGLREMQPEKAFYPDANFTMRLSYGTVGGYKPADAVEYHYLTTLAGVMEKEDPDNWEFVVSPKLKELYNKKDFGPYADGDNMYVCFLTNNDITGGNSGSPVIDAKGNLIGIAFDGNWEAMSGDIAFEHKLQRCINMDMRYFLFVLDKYAGARHLLEEIKIIR